MYSLSTHEKLKEERGVSAREILWRHLRNRKKSGRMVRRIYNKTREEMAHSRRERSQKWIVDAVLDTESWSRAPEMSVHQHTFRDRRKDAEIGPANGHISARNPIGSSASTSAKAFHEFKDDNVSEGFAWLLLSGSSDLLARASRLVFSGGGKLDNGKTLDLMETLSVPSRMRGNAPNALHNPCRPTVTINDTEHSEKWVGDQIFYPGFRFRDNQRETLAGDKFPTDITNDGNYKGPKGFSRDCYSEEKLPGHRFRLVVRNNEYACPAGKIRRSLRFKKAPPEPYPNEKTYFTSLKSVSVNSATTGNPRAANPIGGRLSTSSSLGSFARRECMHDDKCTVRGGDVTCKVGGNRLGGGQVLSPLPRSKSSTVVRFLPEYDQAAPEKDTGKTGKKDEDWRRTACRHTSPMEKNDGSVADFSGGLRRVSEVASWATSGAAGKSARDYLW